MKHSESHRTHRIGWLRAAVLGANDGIVSTASLIVGVAAADPGRSSVMVAGLAGLRQLPPPASLRLCAVLHLPGRVRFLLRPGG